MFSIVVFFLPLKIRMLLHFTYDYAFYWNSVKFEKMHCILFCRGDSMHTRGRGLTMKQMMSEPQGPSQAWTPSKSLHQICICNLFHFFLMRGPLIVSFFSSPKTCFLLQSRWSLQFKVFLGFEEWLIDTFYWLSWNISCWPWPVNIISTTVK